ncbi:MAG: hypothetical protein PHP98_06545 [Kiritimatiellae bacterium]|jgi:collagenase-like PrtC family protease|nr:hypothetical protein [Kiritimatiellia bacterium]
MKFSVGYQLSGEDEPPFSGALGGLLDHVAEVYFPWPDTPSGRAVMAVQDGCVDWNGRETLENDLRLFKKRNIKLNLLLNANCYGRDSLSEHFRNFICSLIAHLCENIGLDGVTTASLFAAAAVRKEFPALDVRASVNMRIGTIGAMKMAAAYFDSFCVQREFNRDLERLAELKNWADGNGKKLIMLANSGCFNFCPGQVFHDNLVAHEREISGMKNTAGWNPCVCRNYLADRRAWSALLQNSWVRPEELVHYGGLFPLVKLATRMHANPERVLRAYIEGKFTGNLLDLFEPGFAPLLYPFIIDNTRFPADWFRRTTSCSRRCGDCKYCEEVMDAVLVKL